MNKLIILWSEFDNYTKILHCTCVKCKCKVGEEIMKMVAESKTHQFSIGLNNESFSIVRS